MFTRAYLVIVLGCLSVANAQNPFCSGDLCFISPDPNSRKTFIAAHQRCTENNSTLPVADDRKHQMSIVNALSHFQLDGMDVWLGATAADYSSNNWRWLDGSQYTGPNVQQQGEYSKSYAYIAKRTTEVLAYASPPNASYSYICYCPRINPDACAKLNGTGGTAYVKENRCYIRYEEKLPWFSARNNCLENSCDLPSFSQLSLLDGMVDSSGCWAGLRHSQWNWWNAEADTSSVTFTSWSLGQPNDAGPQCIAISSGDFPNWEDSHCANSFLYICQVSDIGSYSTPSRSFTTATTASTSSTSTTTSTTTTKSPLGTPGTAETSTSANSSLPGIAIGLGIGIPCAAIIIVLVATVIVQQRKIRELRRCSLKYKSGDPEVKESKDKITNSQASIVQTGGNHIEESMPYQELQIRNQLEDQRQYETLPQSQYEQL